MAIAGAFAALFILLWFVFRYSFFIPAPHGLPILLYHKVSLRRNDRLTISVDRLDRQLAHLVSGGYTPVSFSDLKDFLDKRRPAPPKPVLITFDDGYLNNYELAYPLLLKHQVKATIFLPVAFVGGVNEWDAGSEPLMSYDTIREMAGPLIEFGVHSYSHESYEHYSAEQIEDDISRCLQTLEENHCPFYKVFAYPYGRMPAGDANRDALRKSLLRHDIEFAVRIGSRINSLPPPDVYALKRTGIRGTDSFWEFKRKLRKGRTKLF